MTAFDKLIIFLIDEYEYYLRSPLPPLPLIATVLAVIFLLPIILSVFHYRRVKSKDYLIIAGFLVGWMGNILITPLNTPTMRNFEPFVSLITNSILGFSAIVMIFLGTLHAIRSRWEKPPAMIWYGNLFFLIINMAATLPLFLLSTFDWSIQHTLLYRILNISLDIWRLGFTILLFYNYLTVKPVIEYRPARRAILLWLIASIALMVWAIIHLGLRIVANLEFSSNWEFYFIILPELIMLLYYPATIIAVISLFVITTRYPESILISEVQVLRACKIYAVVKAYPQETQPHHWGMTSIKNYLEKIPESIWKEGCD